MVKACRSEEDFRQLVSESQQHPVLLLKHSTRCSISAGAHARFARFAEENPSVACWVVLVVEDRPVSNLVAAETGIGHQSPQAILFKEGKPCWHASHSAITQQTLQEALAG